ncbi:MAG: hypothetical protein P8M21_07135 [Halioglobus sp.]|nr:hypothetical protein [Halioglobus sp.]
MRQSKAAIINPFNLYTSQIDYGDKHALILHKYPAWNANDSDDSGLPRSDEYNIGSTRLHGYRLTVSRRINRCGEDNGIWL